MRLRDIGDAQHRLLRELTGRISNRLEGEFTELPGADGQSVGVELRERGKKITLEIPTALLLRANGDSADLAARESVRTRLKAARDRMLFKPPPVPLPRRIAAAPDPASPRFGFGGGGFRSGRGRR